MGALIKGGLPHTRFNFHPSAVARPAARLHPCLPADELLEQFLESFPEETAQVQLQLMTATVKLFLKKPVEKPQQLIQLVLTYATQETDNPDLRDRAYIYWRLLSTDPGGWGWMGLGGRQTRPCGG